MGAGYYEFVTKEASNGVFSRCITTNMLKYALAERCSAYDFRQKTSTFAFETRPDLALVREMRSPRPVRRVMPMTVLSIRTP